MLKWNYSFSHLIRRQRIFFVLAVVLVVFLCTSFAHTAPKTPPSPYAPLLSLLKARNFVKAERYADSLVRTGDTAALVRESLCVALLEQHKQLARVEQLLTELPRTSYRLYLLAQSQCLQYKFKEAIQSYQAYIPIADKLILSDIETKQYIIECQNALQLIKTSFRPILYEKHRVGWDSVAEQPTLSTMPYRLIPLPAALYGQFDDASIEPPTLVAYPTSREVGARVVYANRKSKQGQRDLYFVELRGNNLWSQPTELSAVINTPFDEAMGILSEDGKTLYFSSRGQYGMGGFDIFRSTYDAVLHQWNAPENLGFPYNSPYDDYLFGLPDAEGRIVLASNRAIAADSLQIFTLSYDPQQLCEALTTTTDLVERSLFQLTSPVTTTPAVVKQRSAARESSRDTHYREVDSDEEYKKALRIGYEAQQHADSLRKDLEILRERLWNVRTSEERKSLEGRITVLENSMLAAQRKADTHFAKASLIEQEYITGQRTLLNQRDAMGAYTSDAPSDLHLAKPAANVMQSSELKALAEIARQHSSYWNETKALWKQYDAIRKMLEDSISSTVKIGKAEQEAARQSQLYVTKYQENIKTRHRIFSQCLAVAYMKGNREAKDLIFSAEAKAKECHLLAQSLLNNKDVQDEGEAAFFSLLAEELSNLYYELGFSYAWNMDAYRSKVNKRIASYEQLLTLTTQHSTKTNDLEATNNHTTLAPTPGEVIPIQTMTTPTLNINTSVAKAEGLQLLDPSPYATEDDVPRDIVQPTGVIYRLQLGAYSNPIDPSLFQGMYPIIAETLQSGKIRKYYAGAFRLKEQAERGKQITTKCGFPDAFIVAWYNGRKVTLARAVSVENKQETDSNQPRESIIQNAPLGSSYQVIIGTFDGDLPSYVSETVNLLAPGKELMKRPSEDGRNVYFVGLYSEKVQAERLRDNLLASGFIEAKIENIPSSL